ncbi:GDSL family lipase [Bacillus sp. V3B]|nr:GDSL family lipase [Bacillus sp. V3B]
MTTIIAILLSFLWIFGLVWSIQDFYSGKAASIEKKPTENVTEQTNTKDLTVLALGDSLTRGTGDDSGKGYVGLVTDELKKRLNPQEILIYNLGINGQTSSDLLQQLGEQNIARQMGEADVILMTIGGNDLFQKGETLLNLDLENVKQLQQDYLANMKQIFTTIREHNQQATVFLLGLYNPFIELEGSEVTNTIIREWNYATEMVVGQFEKMVFVPTFDLFQLSVNDYLYSDHFHPNQAGYQLISNRVAPLISWEKEVDQDG